VLPVCTKAQSGYYFRGIDSLFNSHDLFSVQWLRDTGVKQLFGGMGNIKIPSADAASSKIGAVLKPSLPKFSKKPLLAVTNGSLQYGLLYNSHIDTPYTEKNILQQQMQASMQVLIAQTLPVTVYATLRKSNSVLYRDIYDIRADIDFETMRQIKLKQWTDAMRQQLERPDLSLAAKQLQAYRKKLSDWKNITNRASLAQQYQDYQSILKNPAMLQDSLLASPELKTGQEQLLEKARQFVRYYKKADSIYHYYSAKADSLEARVQDFKNRYQQYSQLLNMVKKGGADGRQIAAWAQKQGMQTDVYQRWLPLLTSYKKLSLGRTLVNRNDLITNNTRINGVNFEYYNRWFVTLTAGAVDFRIRDFVTRRQLQLPKETLLMGRLGLGQPQGNHVAISYFTGRRQDLFGQRGPGGVVTLKQVSGIGLGARWQITPYSFLQWEVGHSLRGLPIQNVATGTAYKNKIGEWQSKAIMAKLRVRLPKLQTLFEGQYRYFGGLYQSFANNRVIGDNQSWSVNASQTLWKNRLRLNGYIKTFDYDNRFTPLQLHTRSIVKGINASYRQKKMPLINVSYTPASQIVNNNGVFTENTYQVLNVNLHHQYKIGLRKTMASLMVNRFYNRAPDTAFSFYNATGVYYQQQVWFTHYTANVGVNYNENNFSKWTILEGGVQTNFGKRVSLGVTGRVINMNNQDVKTGFQFNGQARLWKEDYISAGYQRSFVPVSGRKFDTNDFLNVQFFKRF
jgi:opacity protein-like surface antigen